jgi:hypothetical protein
MLRETTFLLGGAVTIALGIALGVGLVWAGADWIFFEAYLAAAIAVGLGVFFLYVGWAEGAERRRHLATADPESGRPR